MSFMEEYKRLDKLCGDLLNNERRLSAYIDFLAEHPDGAYYADDWNTVLRQLKHYRWMRTQIAHEPGCTEENMCDKYDVDWLRNFYDRILQRTDPLAIYYSAKHTQQKRERPHTNSKNLSKLTKRSYTVWDYIGNAMLSVLWFVVICLIFAVIYTFITHLF